ncbi:hypothetical protein [Paenibacillus cremeus]|uniref:Uncharacterized protein n=1 Tax=Paenibacillus cremeus TaxID=2163881 RepID=A0A559K4R2_9BACL|nr:hypothetical protein [Paenibacillus cremeus]TVY07106.1 hypothetical protein FPZ49_25890 [Paenibacillus cremeus]
MDMIGDAGSTSGYYSSYSDSSRQPVVHSFDLSSLSDWTQRLQQLRANDLYPLNGNKYDPNVESIQKQLAALGYTDMNGELLNITGLFGSHSRSALQKYLNDYDFQHFTFAARDHLDGLLVSNLIPFDSRNYSNTAQYAQIYLKILGYTDPTGHPLKLDGYFGRDSNQALRHFLNDNGISSFTEEAFQQLKTAALNKIDSEPAPYVPQYPLGMNHFGFAYGGLDKVSRDNLSHAIAAIKGLKYVVTTEPGAHSIESKFIAEQVKGTTRLFGYVNLGPENQHDPRSDWVPIPLDKLKQAIDRIQESGFYGVFIDQFGFDYQETRERQNEIVDYAHSKGLYCIANAWFPEDAMSSRVVANGNPNGLPSSLGPGDYYLAESFMKSETVYGMTSAFLEKYLRMRDLQEQTGVGIIGLTYKNPEQSWQDALSDNRMSNYLAQILGFKGYWFSDQLVSLTQGVSDAGSIGSQLVEPLHEQSTGIYVAKTDQYEVTVVSGDEPHMMLKPLSGDGEVIHLGKASVNDDIVLSGLSPDNQRAIQRRLNRLGYRDSDGNPLAEDGFIGSVTTSVLNAFLESNGFFKLKPSSKLSVSTVITLFSSNAINAVGAKGLPDAKDPKAAEGYISADRIRKLMDGNSRALTTASEAEKNELRQANQTLGKLIQASYDPISGEWSYTNANQGIYADAIKIWIQSNTRNGLSAGTEEVRLKLQNTNALLMELIGVETHE